MAKILYGVAGEGFGHSSRSEMFGRKLIEAGHEIMFAASRKSHHYLEPVFSERVKHVHGLRFVYLNGSVRPLSTLWRNVVDYTKGYATNRRLFEQEVQMFKPDMVISDFEPFSAWWAWRNKVPCLSVDHEHLLTLARMDKEPRYRVERWMANVVTRGYHTFANTYIILNFFNVPLRNTSAVLVPPVVRPIVLEYEAGREDHIVVYSTDSGEDFRNHILTRLMRFGRQRFRIYGFNREGVMANCTFKKSSAREFVSDLASCRGVIATAGFSLISECLHFGKRMLLMPVQDQYEQIVNAYYVDKLDLGMRTETLTTASIEAFLSTLNRPLPSGGAILRPDNDYVFMEICRQAERAGISLDCSIPQLAMSV